MIRVLLDMDDVIANCVGYWTRELFHRYGVNITPADVDRWDISNTPKLISAGLSREQIFAPMNEPGFFAKLPMVRGAQSAVHQMKEKSWDVVIVTSLPLLEHRSGQVIDEKLYWLKENFQDLIPERNVIFTYRKDLVSGTILIDDAPHNLSNYPGKTAVFDRPWNKEIGGTIRIQNWNTGLSTLEKLLSDR